MRSSRLLTGKDWHHCTRCGSHPSPPHLYTARLLASFGFLVKVRGEEISELPEIVACNFCDAIAGGPRSLSNHKPSAGSNGAHHPRRRRNSRAPHCARRLLRGSRASTFRIVICPLATRGEYAVSQLQRRRPDAKWHAHPSTRLARRRDLPRVQRRPRLRSRARLPPARLCMCLTRTLLCASRTQAHNPRFPRASACAHVAVLCHLLPSGVLGFQGAL